MKIPIGKYCAVYGDTLSNNVLEYFLTAYDTDIAASEIIALTNISKPKVYQIIDEFIKKDYVTKSRIIGKTQLYKLNRDNPIVKIFIRNFKECIGLNIRTHSSSRTAMTASTKSI